MVLAVFQRIGPFLEIELRKEIMHSIMQQDIWLKTFAHDC